MVNVSKYTMHGVGNTSLVPGGWTERCEIWLRERGDDSRLFTPKTVSFRMKKTHLS